MITAPILQGGVEVQIPQAEVAPLPASEAIVVSVDRDGAIYIDDTQVRWTSSRPRSGTCGPRRALRRYTYRGMRTLVTGSC